MQRKLKKWLKPILFTLSGIIAGLLYYLFVGCKSGSCAITSNAYISMAYGGLLGWLISGVFSGGCCCGGGKCNM